MKKIGMLGVVNNLGTRLYSHNAGWTHVTRNILSNISFYNIDLVSNNDDFDQYDTLIINEGVNFKPGVFNFFGGVQDRQLEAIKRFSNYSGEVLYLNQIADYTIPCKKRKDLSDYADLTFPKGRIIDITKRLNSIIIGDSHSVSAFKPGKTINRLDGKTLNGALKIGLENLIPGDQKDVQFYFGNIDVRFHFKRFGGIKAIDSVINTYKEQLIDLKQKGYTITLTHLIPIEDESRKIPGTGKYLGQNFFGSKEERSDYVRYFNCLIDQLSEELQFNVEKWHNLDYNSLSFDDMESRQSVHIRPSSYMYFNQLLNN